MHYFLLVNGWILVAVIFIFNVFTIINSIKLIRNNPKKHIKNCEICKEIPEKNATLSEVAFLMNPELDEYGNLISAILIRLVSKGIIKIDGGGIKILNFNSNNLNDDEYILYNFLIKAIGNDEYLTITKISEVCRRNYFGVHFKNDILQSAKKRLSKRNCYSAKFENLRKICRLKDVVSIITILLLLMLVIVTPKVVIPLILLTIISGLCNHKVGRIYEGFTEKGYNEKEKWIAYNKFITAKETFDLDEFFIRNNIYNALAYSAVCGGFNKVLENIMDKVTYYKEDSVFKDNIDNIRMKGNGIAEIFENVKKAYGDLDKNNYITNSNNSVSRTHSASGFSSSGGKSTGGGR